MAGAVRGLLLAVQGIAQRGEVFLPTGALRQQLLHTGIHFFEAALLCRVGDADLRAQAKQLFYLRLAHAQARLLRCSGRMNGRGG